MGKRFKTVANFSELKEGQGRRVVIGDRPIALFKTGDEVHAIDHRCPHQGGPLANGFVHQCRVTCPLHGWDFDLRTGRESDGGTSVTVHEVRVEDDKVHVAVNTSGTVGKSDG